MTIREYLASKGILPGTEEYNLEYRKEKNRRDWNKKKKRFSEDEAYAQKMREYWQSISRKKKQSIRSA